MRIRACTEHKFKKWQQVKYPYETPQRLHTHSSYYKINHRLYTHTIIPENQQAKPLYWSLYICTIDRLLITHHEYINSSERVGSEWK